MPPKKTRATKAAPLQKKAAVKSKNAKSKEDSDDEPPAKMQKQDSKNTKIKKAFEKIKKVEKLTKKPPIKLDEYWPFAKGKVYEDYACMLNQTNINANNNKFYLIQLLDVDDKKEPCALFTRWGRVGEIGQQAQTYYPTFDSGIKEFKKKFKDKTKNDWDNRENFVPQSKKYTLIEIDQNESEEEDDEKEVKGSKNNSKNSGDGKNSSLDPVTLKFIQRIFDEKMFTNTMENFNLDIKKMPLGKLSKTQISKGFDVLVELEDSVNSGRKDAKQLETLSSQFYTLIPHAFGRRKPVVLDSSYLIGQKKEMLLVLSDIELTQSLQKEAQTDDPNPWDEKYRLLHCDLSPLPKTEEEYKLIETYYKQTMCDWSKSKLLNIWKVDREKEGDRFKGFQNIVERKLLWHGTNIAVVAAILSSGLRIMPHSGGRVGKGIYFASIHGKSSGYTSSDAEGVFVMFLNEVALGKEHTITFDNSNLKAAPKGCDCVVARGRIEPDPKHDAELVFDGKKVTIPQGKPTDTKYKDSSFHESEYLVYNEGQ